MKPIPFAKEFAAIYEAEARFLETNGGYESGDAEYLRQRIAEAEVIRF